MLDRFTEDLAALQRAIRWGDGDALFDLFTAPAPIRRSIIEAGQDTPAPDFGRDGSRRAAGIARRGRARRRAELHRAPHKVQRALAHVPESIQLECPSARCTIAHPVLASPIAPGRCFGEGRSANARSNEKSPSARAGGRRRHRRRRAATRRRQRHHHLGLGRRSSFVAPRVRADVHRARQRGAGSPLRCCRGSRQEPRPRLSPASPRSRRRSTSRSPVSSPSTTASGTAPMSPRERASRSDARAAGPATPMSCWACPVGRSGSSSHIVTLGIRMPSLTRAFSMPEPNYFICLADE